MARPLPPVPPALPPRPSAPPLPPQGVHKDVIRDSFTSFDEVQEALRERGLESSNLIVGVDFTKSNEWSGKKSFGGRCMHQLQERELTPYQEVLCAVAQTLEAFDDDKLIPCYGFGDARTGDHSVFSFKKDDRPCFGLLEVLKQYDNVAPVVALSGPTSFAPLISKALEIVVDNHNSYHILVIVCDGEVTDNGATRDAIVRASNYPMSIVCIGVGDGPWAAMEFFDDELPERIFDNFQFIAYNTVKQQHPANIGPMLAMHCLMEAPDQFQAIRRLQLLGGNPPRPQARTRTFGPPEETFGLDPFVLRELDDETREEVLADARAKHGPTAERPKRDWAALLGRSAGAGAALAALLNNSEIVPRRYVCPISQEIMEDPVVAADGHTFERAQIEDWLREHDTSPLTNEPLPNKALFPNRALREEILEFLRRNPGASA